MPVIYFKLVTILYWLSKYSNGRTASINECKILFCTISYWKFHTVPSADFDVKTDAKVQFKGEVKVKTRLAFRSNVSLVLRWIKEWICSERPITLCPRVKNWLCQGSRIWPKGDVTRRQRPMRALVSFTLLRNVCTNKCRTQLLGYLPQPACSGWRAGSISTCFYSSKLSGSIRLLILLWQRPGPGRSIEGSYTDHSKLQ